MLLINVTEVTTDDQKQLKISTNRIKALFLPEGQQKPRPKPSAGARSKSMYEKAERCPNTGVSVTLPEAVNFFFGKLLSELGKQKGFLRNQAKF